MELNTRHEIHARVHHTPVRQKERGPLLPKPITWNPKSYCWPPSRCTSIISADTPYLSPPPPPHTQWSYSSRQRQPFLILQPTSRLPPHHHYTRAYTCTDSHKHARTLSLSLSLTHTHSLSLHVGGRRGVGSGGRIRKIRLIS